MMGYVGIAVAAIVFVAACSGTLLADEVHTQPTDPDHETGHASPGAEEWTCGMHPSVRMSGPGKCPICNMDLIPVAERAGEANGPVTVELGERARALAGISTSEVRFLPLYKEIRTVGRIDYDEREVANVAARVPGRIDKLYVDFTGIEVKKGEPLAYLYSPSLVSTQNEYLWALRTEEAIKGRSNTDALERAESLVEAAGSRLRLWGITEGQIAELERSGRPKNHMIIVSPVSGTVIRKMAVEGNYVKEGDHLYHIVDLSNLWVYADIYESELSWIRLGQPVAFTTLAHGDEKFVGEITFIDPFLDEKTRSVRVRIDVSNTDMKLRPGMFTDVTIRATPEGGGEYYVCPMHPEVVSEVPEDCTLCGMDLVKVSKGVVMALPKSAVLDTGRRKLVYVEKEPGSYEAREVTLDPQALAQVGDQEVVYYPVRKGVGEGERVVTRGNFLIDSQSQLSGPAASMYDASLGEENEQSPRHQH
jgi:Cu(I)/Ag(I) efflux system membrane fusion protein